MNSTKRTKALTDFFYQGFIMSMKNTKKIE